MNEKRIHPLNNATIGTGPIIYWMSREQRVRDNWGLLYARQLAANNFPIIVVFCLAKNFLGATLRQYDFMLSGIQEVEQDLTDLNISFCLLHGDPVNELTRFAHKTQAGCIITDFDPLRIKQQWQQGIASTLNIPLIEVDSHNIIPARIVSNKQEYAARTIRPKIFKHAAEFFSNFPVQEPYTGPAYELEPVSWKKIKKQLTLDTSVPPVPLPAGEKAAHRALSHFIQTKLAGYATSRNDPNAQATSMLSAYYHFGQLSPHRAALAVDATGKGEDQDSYLEELIIRRELSDNFCLYNPQYDSLQGTAPWALRTLEEHRSDQRKYTYTYQEFEQAKTHSRLWNAAQMQLIKTGYMHGYMRMFWAKKILEWSESPEIAHTIALKLNDRFQLDGRDPNGYVGVLWSIAGLHDRAWKKRSVYGSIRYMNERGCRRKFDVDRYCAQWLDDV